MDADGLLGNEKVRFAVLISAQESVDVMCCDLTKLFSEFDCMSQVADAQAGFTSHWDTWITQADFTTMVTYGIKYVTPIQLAASSC